MPMGRQGISPAYARFRGHRGALVGAGIVAIAVVIALAAPLLAPHAPDEPFVARAIDAMHMPVGPSREFPLARKVISDAAIASGNRSPGSLPSGSRGRSCSVLWRSSSPPSSASGWERSPPRAVAEGRIWRS